ncbi:hypothetical protein KXQ82_15515 [Mucilaginibacter sp. HMF5004]|uniref:hypothetical protein n=1 Tax=Mucilaginibacter rivuli TaxID=2857527 RepID=UPI001C5E20AC|nr:hypothetical protein [Mucilaginibacter rivuli]MBW4891133.1 hypothetical protein [Mucilaginibacter rivuli]
MSYSDKYLQAHGLFHDRSFEEFCSEIPVFYFKKEVPEDVIQNFEVVEKLLAFSYYEYKFIDEAYSKAVHTLEMAMAIRYNELSLPRNGKLVFDHLIKSLVAENCFDTNMETLIQVKQTRNHFAHPDRHSFGGVVYWNRIEFISRLVNELYENVSLRIERRKLSHEFIADLHKRNLNKFIIMKKGANAPVILFDLSLLWINNKLPSYTYQLQYTPLFDLTYETEYQINVPEIFSLKITEPKFIGKKLRAIDTDTGDAICFSSIMDNPDRFPLFEKWKHEYDSIKWNGMFEHSIQMASSNILVPELQKFHKT